MTNFELTVALETLQKAGTISAGWVVRGEDMELAPGDTVTDQQVIEALAEWQDTKARRKIWPTCADFYFEFTDAEQYALQTSTNDKIIVARGKLAMWRGEVWGDDPRITEGLAAMVSAGIINEERKDEILLNGNL